MTLKFFVVKLSEAIKSTAAQDPLIAFANVWSTYIFLRYLKKQSLNKETIDLIVSSTNKGKKIKESSVDISYDNKNEIIAQISELQSQKNALETTKHNILKASLAKVNKLRSEKKYTQMVNLVRNVFAKKDPNTNVLEFNSSEHTRQFAELAYTQRLLNEHFGVTMNFKTKKDSKGNTIVDPKSITYIEMTNIEIFPHNVI